MNRSTAGLALIQIDGCIIVVVLCLDRIVQVTRRYTIAVHSDLSRQLNVAGGTADQDVVLPVFHAVLFAADIPESQLGHRQGERNRLRSARSEGDFLKAFQLLQRASDPGG
ncbi:hypothetical protein D3C75_1206250 [compost metagenome]